MRALMRPSCLLASALIVSLTACAPRAAKPDGEGGEATASTSARATDFSLRALDGRTVRLSDYLGKDVVLLSFWATWCVPCLGEMPELEKLYQRYKDQGLTILAISMDGPETIANVEPTVRRHGVTFPVLLDEDTRVSAVFNPTRDAPYAVIIDRSGSIVDRRLGYAPGDEAKLEEKLKSLLTPASAPAADESAR